MNITPTKEEWIQNYLRVYHKRPYTASKLAEAEREYNIIVLKISKENND